MKTMIWALAIVICLFLFIKYPAFRVFTGVVAALAILTLVVYLANQKHEEETSKKLVNQQQLQFDSMTLGTSPYGSDYELKGRIKNNSPYSVYSVMAKVQLSDCDAEQHCEVVGEEEEDIAPLIPPGQVRDVSKNIYFSGSTKIRGKYQWNYSITQIQARK